MLFSKLVDYGLIILSKMNTKTPLSARYLCKISSIPLATTNKLLQLFVKNKICSSVLGKVGGFKLNKELSAISLLSVIVAIHGEQFKTVSCLQKKQIGCHLFGSCSISSGLAAINNQILDILKNKNITDLLI